MMRINVLLIAAVLASALWLVRQQYEMRTLYTAVDRAVVEARKLEIARDTLDVQKRTQAASLHVQSVARNQLGMRETTPAITQYVTLRTEGGAGEEPFSAAPSLPASSAGTAQHPPAQEGQP